VAILGLGAIRSATVMLGAPVSTLVAGALHSARLHA
jgi:hypothetical protein